jgi:magnesium chelatase family protein
MLAQPFAGLLRPMTVEEALQGKEIDTHTALDAAAAKFLNIAAARLGWSARSTHRALKVARTIADLAGAAGTQTVHVAEAVQYRRALATTSGA